jgi:hypothetical protein
MHLAYLASTLLLLPLTSAWKVGLWGHNADRQFDGTFPGCNEVSPGFKAGQVTFDRSNKLWAKPSQVFLYPENHCYKGTHCFSHSASLTGVVIPGGCTVRSFSIV